MNLRCEHCGERIVARSFGKCPGCYRELPEELQLSKSELEMKELDEREARKQREAGGGADASGGGECSLF